MKSSDDDEESELFLNNLRYVEKAFDRVVTYLTFDLSETGSNGTQNNLIMFNERRALAVKLAINRSSEKMSQ